MRILLGRDSYARFIAGADHQTALPGAASVRIRSDAPTASTCHLTIRPTSADLESRDAMFSSAQQRKVYGAFPASWQPRALVVVNIYAALASTPFRVARLAPLPSGSL